MKMLLPDQSTQMTTKTLAKMRCKCLGQHRKAMAKNGMSMVQSSRWTRTSSEQQPIPLKVACHQRVTSRLVREIREGDSSGPGALSKVWDFDMEDREAEFKDDLREASGIGKRRSRKVGITRISPRFVWFQRRSVARKTEGRHSLSASQGTHRAGKPSIRRQ